jgi:hypothetical protein
MVAALLCVGGTTGCNSGGLPNMVPIRGEVRLDGSPVAEGQVVYLPKDPSQGRQASGPIKPDGTFVLTTLKAGDGAMAGDYDIVVFGYGTDPGKGATSRAEMESSLQQGRASGLPERYADAKTSGLSDLVDRSHSGFKLIELTK